MNKTTENRVKRRRGTNHLGFLNSTLRNLLGYATLACELIQNARIEHDKALARVIVGLMQDDAELFKQFSDNEGFRRWLTDTVFGLTYSDGTA